MPKINVYLPDDLAEAVKDTGVPVSAICQRALEQAVRRITAVRRTALGDLDGDDLAERLPRFTERTRTVVKLAVDLARDSGAAHVGTGHLLAGMLDEGTNLALHVLRAMDIDPERVRAELRQLPPDEEGGAADDPGLRFSTAAAGAIELTVVEATGLGHNYVGCEHLLLGLTADGVAARTLQAVGVEPRQARRAVTAALAGYVHLRAETQSAGDPAKLLAAAVQQQLQPIVERLERLEEAQRATG